MCQENLGETAEDPLGGHAVPPVRLLYKLLQTSVDLLALLVQSTGADVGLGSEGIDQAVQVLDAETIRKDSLHLVDGELV